MSEPILSSVGDGKGNRIGWMFFCPGCRHSHIYYLDRWTFNGDEEKPTFSPSLLNRCTLGEPPKPHRCHLFVRNGMIEFCGDCTHELAGKTVPMEPA